jgi:hypothetical protein
VFLVHAGGSMDMGVHLNKRQDRLGPDSRTMQLGLIYENLWSLMVVGIWLMSFLSKFFIFKTSKWGIYYKFYFFVSRQ